MNIAPPVPGTETASTVAEEQAGVPRRRLNEKLAELNKKVEEIKSERQETIQKLNQELAHLRDELGAQKDKTSRKALKQIRSKEELKEAWGREFDRREKENEKEIRKIHRQLRRGMTPKELMEEKILEIDNKLVQDRQTLEEVFGRRRETLEVQLQDKDRFVKEQALELYRELSGLKKGVKASEDLGYLLDHGYTWDTVKSALLSVKDSPGKNLTPNHVLRCLCV